MLRLPSLSVRGFLKKLSRRHRSLFGPRFWGLNFGRRTGPYRMASTVPRLHGAVELLLTGDQHKPCTSFNQQACKNTTSVAEGKRKIPQKIAPKCAKILKNATVLGVQKLTRFGVKEVLKKRIRTLRRTPKRVNFWTTKTGAFFSIFLRILGQFFAVFSACLLLRMLYFYMPVD